MTSAGTAISVLLGAVAGLIGALIPIITSRGIDAATEGNVIVRGLAAIGVSFLFLTILILVSFLFFRHYLETFSVSSLIVFIVAFSVYGVERAIKFNRKRK